MARYLVTGGAGFIGSHLLDSLIADGHYVRVLDDLSSGTVGNLPPNIELMVSDVSEPESARRGLNGMDGCFHLAAIASVERCNQDWLRSHSVNLSGTIAVFEEARRIQGISGEPFPVVYASSAAVYGNPSQIPISELTPTCPTSAYGVDKLGCDLHAAVAARVHKMSTIGLRFFNIYGPRQDPQSSYSGVISVFCNRALQLLPFEVHGDGGQVRDFVYIDDAIRALRKAMQMASLDPPSRVFNICSGIGTSIRDLGETISLMNGASFSPRYAPARTGDVRTSVGDPRLAKKQLHFSTDTSLREGLSRTLHSISRGRWPAFTSRTE
jgi:UDP-glucose 4-epimerase